MNTLLVEPFSGLSGDMFLGALCQLTDAYDEIEDFPKLIGLPDGKVEIHEVEKNGIHCKHVEVIDLNEHQHDHGHHHNHHAPHRHLSDIIEIIDKAKITDNAKQIAKGIFQEIGHAESSVHNIPIEKIHFHEISAVDSIIDIVGSAVLIDRLNIDHCYSHPICVGSGMVNTQHGKLPVPAPATALLLQGMPTYTGDEKGERTTPTGAAILRFLKPIFQETTPHVIQKIAYGPGKKDFIAPNVLRLSIAKTLSKRSASKGNTQNLYAIETNLDDATPESLGTDFQNGLLTSGAIDFSHTSITMKKGRSGVLLWALAEESNRTAVANYILENTPSIGIRHYPVERQILDREIQEIDTPLGPAHIKIVTTPSGSKRFKVEHDDLIKIANANKTPLQTARQTIETAALKELT